MVGFTSEFRSLAPRQSLTPEVLRRRLLLVLFALGTNTGIARVAGDHVLPPTTTSRLTFHRESLTANTLTRLFFPQYLGAPPS